MAEEKNRSLASPQAKLEKMYIEEYLREKGFLAKDLTTLPEKEAVSLMTEASRYASLKLAELESQARLHTKIHHATNS